jgi:nicotinamidase-related amidase
MSYQGYDISASREIIPRVKSLLTTFRAHGFPIYHTREGHRPDLSTLSSRELTRSKNNESGLGIGDHGPLGRLLIRGEQGHDIIPELYPVPGENVIDKPGRSAFQHTEFRLMLNIKGIKNLVICGVTTDVCVHSTMREANDNGFDCLLVEDAAAASEPNLHTSAVESVKAEGGIFGAVSTTQKIIAALEIKQDGEAKASAGKLGNSAAFLPGHLKFIDPLTLTPDFSYETPIPTK